MAPAVKSELARVVAKFVFSNMALVGNGKVKYGLPFRGNKTHPFESSDNLDLRS